MGLWAIDHQAGNGRQSFCFFVCLAEAILHRRNRRKAPDIRRFGRILPIVVSTLAKRCIVAVGLGLALSVGLWGQQQTLPVGSQPAPTDARMSPNGGYERPTAADTVHAILSDSVGPYPVILALGTAAIHQKTDNPPDWGQGAGAYGARFGSSMGITIAGNAARYGLAAAMNVNTLYYRCSCTGIGDRFRHALLSTIISRQRDSGERAFSYPNVVAPYAGTFTAVYAWYPRRFEAMDAFRMGNFNLLGTAGTNLVFEFLPRKVDDYLRSHHLSSSRITEAKTAKP